MRYIEQRMHAGLSDSDVAKLFGVTKRTIHNWRTKNNHPESVRFALRMLSGDVSALGSTWNGFTIYGGLLANYDGNFIYPGEISALNYLYQVAGLERINVINSLDTRNLLYFKSIEKPEKPINTEKIINFQIVK